MNNLIQLFQLVDSSLPIGGFVYSMGMESAIKSKLLQNEEDLKRYLVAYTDQLISFEFPFLEAGHTTANKSEKWTAITTAYQSMLMNPNLEKSALVLGKNWTRLLYSLYKTDEINRLKKQLKEQQIPVYYTIVFGMFMSVLKIGKAEARSMYLYAALRDQITALTRLGIVGPMGGQGLLTYVLEKANEKNNLYQTVPYYSATKSAYIMEIVQLNHHKIYSKLFQN
ncbi:urease accessory protein UreF [Aquimarina sp. RZ0]|uniref:urease accessory protein UreF n=1 Tax=Aquimarina sp. RZ0 TaxID=2607730 RepID=UPI0011F2629F|nr:urease accessory UreF family protein [Aquimarina sp. RZ0]KAA1247494.1 hypothetical protein F0000_03280 [Aquimarina sp. RZ0]